MKNLKNYMGAYSDEDDLGYYQIRIRTAGNIRT
jgi:hypothetical protein